jgi:hypothetical protein
MWETRWRWRSNSGFERNQNYFPSDSSHLRTSSEIASRFGPTPLTMVRGESHWESLLRSRKEILNYLLRFFIWIWLSQETGFERAYKRFVNLYETTKEEIIRCKQEKQRFEAFLIVAESMILFLVRRFYFCQACTDTRFPGRAPCSEHTWKPRVLPGGVSRPSGAGSDGGCPKIICGHVTQVLKMNYYSYKTLIFTPK